MTFKGAETEAGSFSVHPTGTFRLIARLDIKAPNLVKGVRLEGLRVIGSPAERAYTYYREGADEIMYQDIVASLYGRASITELVEQTAQSIFVPLTVGGGVRSIEDVNLLLRAGADRVAVNTALVDRPQLVGEIAKRHGSQCMTLSIEAGRLGSSSWEVLTNCGRERTGIGVVEWARRCADLGAGEILLTSVDREGTRAGFDLDLLSAVLEAVDVPVIAHGGAGNSQHVVAAAKCGASGVALASVLHYGLETVASIKESLIEAGFQARLS
jgi:cyclase